MALKRAFAGFYKRYDGKPIFAARVLRDIDTGEPVVVCKNAGFAREAAEYSNIVINKSDSMLRAPNCPFVLFVGTKKLVKRREFEQYISRTMAI